MIEEGSGNLLTADVEALVYTVMPDVRAVVFAPPTQLGWVPDPLVDYVRTLIDSGPFSVAVTRNNGPEAPPNLRLLVTVKGRVPIGYRPFGDE